MPPVIQVGDQNELVPTKNFPFGKYPFQNFNPVQSRIYEFYEKDCNLVIASATSSGKTIMSELAMAHTIRVKKQKAMYLTPLRALAQEKYDDWTDKAHHFSDLNISICTGDYRLTNKRIDELNKSDIIIMSSEMLNHRMRNLKSEQSGFLSSVGAMVVDEFHLITVPNRGDHLESGLMKFTEHNSGCRIVLLSATMPNVAEIADWVSYILTGRETVLVQSTYRPCPLNLHYEKYYDGEQSYEANELQKVSMAMQILNYYPDDKFLIFAHTKKTGEIMKTELTKNGIQCEFHNADLDKAKRCSLEKRFKEDKNFRALIATSTLAWGCNLPARRVIILGVHRGMAEVETYDIFQMIGRAGRPLYDPIGDAYILLPEKYYDMHKARLKKQRLIESQMLSDVNGKYKVLAFHLVSEIYQGNIQTRNDVHHWYKRSLACFQSHDFDEEVVDSVITLLRKCGAVWEEGDKLTVTSVGKVASLFYYSPFDVADLKRNMTYLFENGLESDDFQLSFALGHIDTQKCGIVSRSEREEMSRYAAVVSNFFSQGTTFEPGVKAGFAYHLLLNGKSNTALAAMCRGLHMDFPRLNQVLMALDGFGGKWGKREWLKQLQLRMTYGVKGPMVYLCQVPNIGKVRATKLWQAGIKTVDDIVNNPEKVRTCLGVKKEMFEEIITGAKAISYMEP